jgi:hypothetical protein
LLGLNRRNRHFHRSRSASAINCEEQKSSVLLQYPTGASPVEFFDRGNDPKHGCGQRNTADETAGFECYGDSSPAMNISSGLDIMANLFAFLRNRGSGSIVMPIPEPAPASLVSSLQ